MSIGSININLDRPGLNLVLGMNLDEIKSYESNGAAKSALFEAMVWACYGKLLRGDMTVDQVIRTDQKFMDVQLIIDPEDGNESVCIHRSRNRKNATVSVKNITSGIELFPSNSATDIQQYIDTWLGADFKTFTNSVYFGKGLAKSFMAASDSDRKELLDTILQVISFDDALASSKAKVKALSEELVEAKTKLVALDAVYDSKRSDYENQNALAASVIENNTNIIEINEIKLPITEEEINRLDSLVTKLTTKFEKAKIKNKSSIEEVQLEKINKLKNIDKQYLLDLTELNSLFSHEVDIEYEENLKGYQEAFNSLVKQENNYKKEFRVVDLKFQDKVTQKSLLEKELKNITSSLVPNKECTTCKQIISLDHVQSSKEIINGKIYVLSTCLDTLDQERKAVETWLVKINVARQQIIKSKEELITKKIAEKRAHEASLNYSKEQLLHQAHILKDSIVLQTTASFTNLTDEFNDIQKEYYTKNKELSETLSDLKNTFKVSKKIIQTAKAENISIETTLITLKSDIEALSKAINELITLIASKTTQVSQFEFWVEAFGPKGIKSFIFETALPYITEKANYYSTKLTGGTVLIEILPTTTTKTTDNIKEKLFVSAKNSLGANVYNGNSDGEKRRIDICILLALQDLISTRVSKVWNTVVFDEIFENLDKPGIINVIELLRDLSGKSIFLISHKEDIKQYFDTAIVIKKHNGVSSLKE